MNAQCWSHAIGLAQSVKNAPGVPEPMGLCFECSTLACAGHAEMDHGSGKWICFQCIARMAAASAGVGRRTSGMTLTTSEEFETRFPALASATTDERAAARATMTGSGEVQPPAASQPLLADAVGIARSLVPEDHTPTMHVESLRPPPGTGAGTDLSNRLKTLLYVFPGPFGELLAGTHP